MKLTRLIKNIFIFLSICTIPVACSNELSFENTNLMESELNEKVRLYYNLESEKKWEQTYLMRDRVFKETVSKEFYFKMMVKNSKNWKLEKIKIIGVENISSKIVNVFIEFHSIRGNEYHRFTETTQWIKESDEWYTVIPGKRGVFMLNDWVSKQNPP